MSRPGYSFTVSARTAKGMRALLAGLHRLDKLREVQACQAFLDRAILAWRRQDSPYAPTPDGMHQALRDELRRMAAEVAAGDDTCGRLTES